MLDLGTPDGFPSDPYGWLTNQCSHILAGLACAWLGGWLGLPPALLVVTCVVAVLAIEGVHLKRGGGLADSAQDAAFVLGGLFMGLSPAITTFVALAIGLGLGVFLRRSG